VRHPLLAALVLISAAGALQAQEGRIVRGDSLLPFRSGSVLWIRNESTDTVWIDTVFVTSCRNIRPCGPVVLTLPIPPGERRDLVRLRPPLSRDPFGYNWTYSWRVVVAVPEEEPRDSMQSKEP
jgi:hypothetical protein